MSSNKKALVCLAMAWAALGAFAGAGPESLIEVLEVPSEISFPMAPHSNAILTVRVPAKKTRQVWLSTSAEFPGRVMLRAIGDGKYQINLADAVVYRVLQADDEAEKFYVYAEDTKGRVNRSLALSFRIGRKKADALDITDIPYARVWTEGAEGDWEQRAYPFPLLALGWTESSARPGPWLAPDHTKKVWFSCRAGAEATFSSGGRRWRMMRAGEDEASLDVTKEIAETVRGAHGASVEYVVIDSGARGKIDMRVPPAALTLEEGANSVTIAENGTASVPGSDGYLEVSVGRIGGYQTLLALKGGDGRVFIRRTAVTRAFREPFEYGDKRYDLVVTRIVQSVFGEDFIVVAFEPHVEAPASGAASQPAE